MKRRTSRSQRVRRESESPTVSILLYETISGYQRLSGGTPPTSLYVNKIATLTAIDLLEEGLSIPLPYSWYKFGPEVESTHREIRKFSISREPEDRSRANPEHPSDDGPMEAEYQTFMEWRAEPPVGFEGDRTAAKIRTKVAELLQQYVTPDRPELLVDRAYDAAPFEFQRSFRMVRMKLGRTGRGSALMGAAQESDLWTLVHDAFERFPAERFRILAPASQATGQVVNYAWNRLGRRDMRTAADALEQFWAVFASHLRLDPLGHSPAVDKQVVEGWRELAEADRVRFDRAIGDLTLRIARVDEDALSDAVLGPIATRRQEERREGDAAIDQALEDAAELRALLGHSLCGSAGG
jgi:hypothetical protein